MGSSIYERLVGIYCKKDGETIRHKGGGNLSMGKGIELQYNYACHESFVHPCTFLAMVELWSLKSVLLATLNQFCLIDGVS